MQGIATEIMVCQMHTHSISRIGKRRFAATMGSALALLPICILGFSDAASASSPKWSTPVVLASSLSKQYGASIAAVSCSAPGDCTAAGQYTLAPGGAGAKTKGFVVTETNGHWGSAVSMSGKITDVSCWSPGNCGAVGNGFVVNQTSGHWGPVTKIQEPIGTTSVAVGGISCPSNGSCVTEGTFYNANGWSAFVLVEDNGRWAKPGAINLSFTAMNTSLFSVSCTSRGNCVAGGEYLLPGFGGMDWQAFVVEETNGLWGIAHEVAPGLPGDSSVAGVSCTAPGNCSGAGMAGSEGYVIDEKNGHWGPGEKVPGTLASADIRSGGAGPISCTSPGNCAATGGWEGPQGWIAFAAAEVAGQWKAAKLVGAPNGGVDGTGAVSCASTGHCVALGHVKSAGIVLIETNGSWSAPTSLPGTSQGAALNAVSCVKAGSCVIGGQLNKGGTTYAFVSSS